MTIDAQDTAQAFADRFGLIAQAQGLPRIAGRIMGLVIIDGGPMSFGEIADRLQISRGSVSTNTRLLENLGVIERVVRTGERQDYFQLASTPYMRLLRGQTEQLEKAQSVIRETLDGLPADSAGKRERLHELNGFYDDLRSSFSALLRKFSETRR